MGLGLLGVLGRDDKAALVADPGPGVAVSARVPLGGDDVLPRVDDLVGAVPLVVAGLRGPAYRVEDRREGIEVVVFIGLDAMRP